MTAVQIHGLGNQALLDQYLAAGFAGRVGWGSARPSWSSTWPGPGRGPRR
ncbi:hypothetical protein [Thermocatellispora tengchongensis]